MYIWVDFSKVSVEIVQKGLILSQKHPISNCRNFGLLAPKLMRFPSNDMNLEDLSFESQKFLHERFSPSQKTRLNL